MIGPPATQPCSGDARRAVGFTAVVCPHPSVRPGHSGICGRIFFEVPTDERQRYELRKITRLADVVRGGILKCCDGKTGCGRWTQIFPRTA